MNLEGLTDADFVQIGDSPIDRLSKAIESLRTTRTACSPEMVAQLERAAFMAAFTYGTADLSSDATVIAFLLDRLERVEDVKSAAYEAIRAIDWAL